MQLLLFFISFSGDVGQTKKQITCMIKDDYEKYIDGLLIVLLKEDLSFVDIRNAVNKLKCPVSENEIQIILRNLENTYDDIKPIIFSCRITAALFIKNSIRLLQFSKPLD